MSEQAKPKIDLETLSPVRQARARCVLGYVINDGGFLIGRRTWREGWNWTSIQMAADDLVEAGQGDVSGSRSYQIELIGPRCINDPDVEPKLGKNPFGLSKVRH